MQKARRHHSEEQLRPLVGTRFQVLFHSPSGVLFTFPSRYLSAIGHLGVLSLGGWSPQIRTAFHESGPTQEHHREAGAFRVRDGCPLWCAVPRASTTTVLCNFRRTEHGPEQSPYNPRTATRARLHRPGLGWIPFRSPLLRESRLISFPRGTQMFHFPRLSSPCLCVQHGMTPHYQRRVSPFGYPRVKGYSAPHRGLSQPFTPFIDSWCQGIHRVPLLS